MREGARSRAAPGHGQYAAQKKTARVLNGKAGASAPPRLFLSLCPRQENQRRWQAGCTPRLPRRCIHEVRRGGRTRPVTFSPPPHSRSMPRRACPPRHVCPAAASAAPAACVPTLPRLPCRRIHELHHGRRIRSATAALLPYPQRVMDAACIPPPERLQNPSFFHKYLQNPAGRRIIRRNDHKVPVRVNDKEGIYHGGSCF